jgi:acetate kinase
MDGSTFEVDELYQNARGKKYAAVAMEVYAARIREAIGALSATLGGLDALTFADGVGENCPKIRAAICEGLEWLGMALDTAANEHAPLDSDIATAAARVRVLVIRTREALMVAREVRLV